MGDLSSNIGSVTENMGEWIPDTLGGISDTIMDWIDGNNEWANKDWTDSKNWASTDWKENVEMFSNPESWQSGEWTKYGWDDKLEKATRFSSPSYQVLSNS